MKIKSWLMMNVMLLQFKLKNLQWYNEYDGHIRIHDYFSLMINQFPILVIRKLDNPHSENENMDKIIIVGLFGFEKIFK